MYWYYNKQKQSKFWTNSRIKTKVHKYIKLFSNNQFEIINKIKVINADEEILK